MKVITLPATNLYLQGRDDKGIVRRGTTRIREIKEYGIPIATASDNVSDPFHPFGRADLLQIAQLTGYTGHLGGRENLIDLLKMISSVPKQIMGIKDRGLDIGNKASFVIFDATTLNVLFSELPQTRAVFGNGRWLSKVWNSGQLNLADDCKFVFSSSEFADHFSKKMNDNDFLCISDRNMLPIHKI